MRLLKLSKYLGIASLVLAMTGCLHDTHDEASEQASQGHNHTQLNPSDEHRIGLQLYSLRNEMAEDLDKALGSIQSWGITEVEGGGALYDRSIDEFKAMLEQRDISIVSVDTSLEEIRDNPIGAAYKAKYFGAKYATIYWIPHDAEKGFTIDDAKSAVDIFNAGGKVLAEHGITLQYHPHGYEFFAHEDGTILDYIIQNTHEAEFQMDVFWIKQGGHDPVEWLQKYPGRFKSLHLKDRLEGTEDTTTGSVDREKANVVLGTGDVGIAAVIAEAKSQGIKYFFIEDESSRVLHQVPKSIEFIKPLVH